MMGNDQMSRIVNSSNQNWVLLKNPWSNIACLAAQLRNQEVSPDCAATSLH